MPAPRGLSADEAALWARVSATVAPLDKEPPRDGEGDHAKHGGGVLRPSATTGSFGEPKDPTTTRFAGGPPPRAAEVLPPISNRHGLDSSWERKLARATIAPDFTLDLHGLGLDAAHARLEQGLALAIAQQARLVLVIAGRPRPVDAADRGSARGAIRAKLLDWLAAGPHASRIAAVRPAHQRHGGAGAVYVVLRRVR